MGTIKKIKLLVTDFIRFNMNCIADKTIPRLLMSSNETLNGESCMTIGKSRIWDEIQNIWKTKQSKISLGKPFKCNFCRKPFKFKSTFDKHMLSHSSLKENKCHICEKLFARANALKEH